MAGGQAAAGRRGVDRLSGLAVGVHDLAQARAVLAWAAAGRHGPIRLHGLDAVTLGGGFWFEVERLMGRPIVVECGDHVGTALAALRAGCRWLRIAPAGAQERALEGLIKAYSAVRMRAGPTVALAPGRAAAAQLARGRCEQVTASSLPGKQPELGIEVRP
jgi:hypothetical protein